MIPTALIHERDAEAAFNGLAKLRELLRRKMPVMRCFEFLMDSLLSNKFKKKSKPNRYNQGMNPPWCDILVCGQCRFDEANEISALTLMQVWCFLGDILHLCFEF